MSKWNFLLGRVLVQVIWGITCCVSLSAEPIVWDFESEEIAWRPRGETVSLSRVEGVGATEDSKASLQVHGYMEGGWNYAMSGPCPGSIR